MLVLHGFWSIAEGLCLWAEDSDRGVTDRSHTPRPVPPHPFAAPATALTDLHPDKPGEATLLLPSLRSPPLDSPELVRITPRRRAGSRPVLLPWRVPVVTLDARTACTALTERRREMRYSASLDYLGDLAGFADHLVTRGRVAPTVDRTEAGAAARWRPVLRGPDVVVLHALATAMPPVCRAVAGQHHPQQLVTAALHALVDAAARATLTGVVQLAPPRRGRRPQRLPAVEAWLPAPSSPDGRFNADPDNLDVLAVTRHPWNDIDAGQPGPARAASRLTEVPVDDPPGLSTGARGRVAADTSSSPLGPPAGDAGPGQAAVAQDSPAAPGRVPETSVLANADSRWRLEFLLQSVQDPSWRRPRRCGRTRAVWTGGCRSPGTAAGGAGRASRSYPELAYALRQPRPSTLDWTPTACTGS